MFHIVYHLQLHSLVCDAVALHLFTCYSIEILTIIIRVVISTF